MDCSRFATLSLESLIEMSAFLEKIKANWTYILEGLIGILTLAFLFERSKKESAEAIAGNQKVVAKVQEIQGQITENQALIDAEEVKRKKLEKEKEDAKSSDSTDFLSKR